MRVGTKGTEFEVTSTVDLSDKYTAHAVMDGYKTLEHEAIYDMIYSDVSYSAVNIGFVVRSVSLVSIKLLRTSVGGLNAGHAWLTARWRLFPVEI